MIRNNRLISKLQKSAAKSNVPVVAAALAASNQERALAPAIPASKDIEIANAITYFVEVWDHSGSMKNIRAQVLAASKEQVDTLQEEGGGEGHVVTATRRRFDTIVHEPDLLNAPIDSLTPMTEEQFNPTNGWTSLYDGVGDTIDLVKKFPKIDDPNTAVYFVIYSDGKENRSKKYSAATVAAKIRSLKDTGRWTFVYIGANQNLEQVSDVLGIEKGNILSFTATKLGMPLAGAANTKALKSYLGKRSVTANAAEMYSASVMLDVAPAGADGIADVSLLENKSK